MKTRLFFIVYTVADLGLILYGTTLLIQPGILLEPIRSHTGELTQAAGGVAGYLLALSRLVGYFNILPGVIGLLLLWYLRTSREKRILRIAIVTTFLAYLGPIIFDNTVGSIGFFEILEHILFGLVILLGILMWRGWEAKDVIR